MPGTIFIVAAPLIWPWPVAFALSMAGTMAASVVGFVFARFVARDWVAARIPARFRRYDAALGQRGLQTVVVLRLIFWMPQPLHFFFGVSRVGFWTHCWGSLIGYTPPLLLVSCLGSGLFDASGRLQPKAWPVMAGLLAASLLVAALARAAGDATVDALVAVSNFPRDQQPPDMVRQRDQNIALGRRLRDACSAFGWQTRLLTLEDRRGLDPARAAAMTEVESQLAEVLPVESWARRLFRHALAAAELDFVSWMPPWLFERWDLSQQALPAGAVTRAGQRGQVALRQTSVAKTGR